MKCVYANMKRAESSSRRDTEGIAEVNRAVGKQSEPYYRASRVYRANATFNSLSDES